jgi:uncharacterized cupredoxin-like copper-binding protein
MLDATLLVVVWVEDNMSALPAILRRALLGTLLTIFGQPLVSHADDYEPVIVISIREYFFEVPGQDRGTLIKVKAGRVYFIQLRNDGKQEHNVEWGRDVLSEDGQPEMYATHLMGYVPVKVTLKHLDMKLLDMTVDGLRDLNKKADEQVELEVTFPESARGEWEIGCFWPIHYNRGMRLPFIVE